MKNLFDIEEQYKEFLRLNNMSKERIGIINPNVKELMKYCFCGGVTQLMTFLDSDECQALSEEDFDKEMYAILQQLKDYFKSCREAQNDE